MTATDIVAAIDTAIANDLHAGYQMGRCAQCDTALNGSVSYYWCGPSCQEDWQAAQADDQMDDGGRGFDEEAAPFSGRALRAPVGTRLPIQDLDGRWEDFGHITTIQVDPSPFRIDVWARESYYMTTPSAPQRITHSTVAFVRDGDPLRASTITNTIRSLAHTLTHQRRAIEHIEATEHRGDPDEGGQSWVTVCVTATLLPQLFEPSAALLDRNRMAPVTWNGRD